MATISLVIKTPGCRFEDFSISQCQCEWTVEDLKLYISKEHPSHVSIENQRLIYVGNELTDGTTLRDLIKEKEMLEGVLVIYLVTIQNQVKQEEGESTICTGSEKKIRKDKSVHFEDDVNSTNSPTSESEVKETAISEGAKLQHPKQSSDTSESPKCRTSSEGKMVNLTAIHPWVAAYVTYLVWTQGERLQQAKNEENRLTDNDRIREDRENDPAEGNFVVNVGRGGEEMGQNDGRRDWLDNIYSLFCFIILLSIAWSYTSMKKFIFFTVFLVLLLMYQAGFFTLRRNRAVRHEHLHGHPPQEGGREENIAQPPERTGEENVAQPPERTGEENVAQPPERTGEENVAQPPERAGGENIVQPPERAGGENIVQPPEVNGDQEQDGQEVNEGRDGQEDNGEVPEGGNEPRPQQQPGVLKTLLIFIVSFFTSLFPQRPPDFVEN